jgi:small subunit ribosomal protein S21
MSGPVEISGRRVEVVDGQLEKALRKFKKKVESSGVLKELRDREFYTPPSVEKVKRKQQAIKRWQKKLNTQKPIDI